MFGGVDTHKDVHVAAALDELGRLLGTGVVPDDAGRLSAAAGGGCARFGEVVAVGVEGTGSWGAGLARSPHRRRVSTCVEVMRPNRQHRRRHGKSDEADAIGAARAVLAGEAVGTPKAQTGQVEAIRLLRVARRSAMKARTQAGNQIHAVIDTAPEQLRRRFVGRPTDEHRRRGRAVPSPPRPTTPLEAARLTLRTLARRWQYLDDELVELDAHLDELTASAAPTLRAINGVGTQVATALLAAAGDNPDRLRSSASFAALCGVSPIDASSGRQQHHRLNRYGDRQANWALHVIIISRLRWHPPPRAQPAGVERCAEHGRALRAFRVLAGGGRCGRSRRRPFPPMPDRPRDGRCAVPPRSIDGSGGRQAREVSAGAGEVGLLGLAVCRIASEGRGQTDVDRLRPVTDHDRVGLRLPGLAQRCDSNGADQTGGNGCHGPSDEVGCSGFGAHGMLLVDVARRVASPALRIVSVGGRGAVGVESGCRVELPTILRSALDGGHRAVRFSRTRSS